MKAYKLLSDLLIRVGGVLNISKRGVPYILVAKDKTKYSIAYFKRGNFYRVFFPFGQDVQTKIDFSDVEDLVNYFN